MIKETSYNGYSAQPSGYTCPDGDLSLSLNVIPENGELKPIFEPRVLKSFGENEQVVYIHQNAGWKHYIATRSNQDTANTSYFWVSEELESKDVFLTIPSEERQKSISSIGNILIISTDEHLYYLLWNATNMSYKHLGTEVPRPQMEFALDGETVSKSYQNFGITQTKSASGTTEDEGYTTIWAGNVYSSPNPARVNVKKDTTYRFINPRGYTFVLEISEFSESLIPTRIAQLEVTSSGVSYKFANDYEYVKLHNRSSLSSDNAYLEIQQGNTITSDYSITFNSENYTALMGIMNSFVAKKATNQDKHIYPFFVRYALKMYDGNYLHISPPILMRPNTGYVPVLECATNNETDNLSIIAYAFIADLQCRIDATISDDWKDIVYGVDIFLSQPVYPYDQGQAYDPNEPLFVYRQQTSSVNNIQDVSYGYLRAIDTFPERNTYYGRISLYERMVERYDFGEVTTSRNEFRVVQVAKKDDVISDILNTSTFYLAKSYTLSEYNKIGNTFVNVNYKKGTLATLATRTALSDEAMAVRTIHSASCHTYNQRMHYFDGSYRLAEPFSMKAENEYFDYEDNGKEAKIFVTLNTSEGEKVVSHTIAGKETLGSLQYLPWYYYPDSRATKAQIVDTSGKMYELPLTAHELLNGAYWLADTLEGLNSLPLSDNSAEPTINDTISIGTSIYVSEPENPFVLTSKSVVSIDCGKILALSQAAKAMSAGQFGQFPLYAFTDNGVWAVEVSTDGAYSARQPITRDVCTNIASLTQIDSSVLFATDRGIMEIAGSTAICLSEVIDSETPFAISVLPRHDVLLAKYNEEITDEAHKLVVDKISMQPFRTFLADCRMVYDYTHQRIIVYNPLCNYAYVYSFLSKAWGMMYTNLTSDVNSYPDALAMTGERQLVNMSVSDSTSTHFLVVTRPIKFGSPDVHKTIGSVIQRGEVRKEHIAQILFGSNDLFNWFAISTSVNQYLRGMAGTPYKYFCLALVGNLQADESISGFSVDFKERWQDKLR